MRMFVGKVLLASAMVLLLETAAPAFAQMMDSDMGTHDNSGSNSRGHGGDHMANSSMHNPSSDIPIMHQMRNGDFEVLCPYMMQGQSRMSNSVHVSYMGKNGRLTGRSRVVGHGRRITVKASVLCKHAAETKVYCTVKEIGDSIRHSHTSTFARNMCTH